jgi:hypothetical protein
MAMAMDAMVVVGGGEENSIYNMYQPNTSEAACGTPIGFFIIHFCMTYPSYYPICHEGKELPQWKDPAYICVRLV